jgi:phosphoenolpyruvate phosphomutase
LENIDAFANKIKQGKSVLLTDDFLIIARIESLIAKIGVAESIKRAEAYLRASADGIMIHSKRKQPDEIFAFAQEYEKLCGRLGFRKPLVSVPTTYNAVTEEELRAYGFNVVIYANHLLRSSYNAMQKACDVILESGRSLETEAFCATVKTISDVVGLANVTLQDQQYATPSPCVIIPAAGPPGDELLRHFPGQPTSALLLKEKTVLQRQLETLHGLGITDAYVITGFQSEAVDASLATTIYNPDFDRTYILDSVFRAESSMQGSFLLIYADILFDKQVIQSVLSRREDIVVVIDNTYILQRSSIKKSKIELVTVKAPTGMHYRRLMSIRQEVKLIGTKINPDLATHEFVGIAYFSVRGAEIFRQVYHDSQTKYCSNRFQEASDFKQAAFTDLLQEVIDRGFTVHALEVSQGWVEIQTLADYQYALEMIENA